MLAGKGGGRVPLPIMHNILQHYPQCHEVGGGVPLSCDDPVTSHPQTGCAADGMPLAVTQGDVLAKMYTLTIFMVLEHLFVWN